ncbi:MAG: hypothetical protein Q8K86_05885 [Candidatus Nanopelagicaceae bacterium]|nr:hypothetical protein [Candidatus Nanopelagicaceae bacterium]
MERLTFMMWLTATVLITGVLAVPIWLLCAYFDHSIHQLDEKDKERKEDREEARKESRVRNEYVQIIRESRTARETQASIERTKILQSGLQQMQEARSRDTQNLLLIEAENQRKLVELEEKFKRDREVLTMQRENNLHERVLIQKQQKEQEAEGLLEKAKIYNEAVRNATPNLKFEMRDRVVSQLFDIRMRYPEALAAKKAKVLLDELALVYPSLAERINGRLKEESEEKRAAPEIDIPVEK